MHPLRHQITALLTAATCSAFGQVLRFQHVGVEDGLSSPVVNCLLEDRSGVIWIGTDRGLDRYDGQRVDPVAGSAWPAGRTVTSIAEHPDGSLWIATADAGLGRYDPATAAMVVHARSTDRTSTWPSDELNHVLVIDQDVLLICTRGKGAFRFSPSNGRCVAMRTGFQLDTGTGDTLWQSGKHWVNSATRIDERRVWLAMTSDRRAPVVDARTGALLEEWRSASKDTISIFSNGLLMGDTLYAGSWGPGLHTFNVNAPQPHALHAHPEQITAFAPWGHGLVAGTARDGLLFFDAQARRIGSARRDRHEPRSLCSDLVRCLLTDRSGNLWVGTGNGLSVHAPAVQRALEIDLLGMHGGARADPVVYDLSQEPDGRIRVATSLGFILISAVDQRVEHVPVAHRGRGLEPTGIIRLPDGRCFIGTESGMFRYDAAHEHVVDGPEGNDAHFMAHGMYQVRGMHHVPGADGARLLVLAKGWGPRLLGAQGGLVGLDISIGILPHDAVCAKDGTVWIAAETGVFRMDPISTRAVLQAGTEGKAYAFTFELNGSPWAATRDCALQPLNGGAEANPPAHLADELVGLATDRQGDLWCATVNGLLRYRPAANEWIRVPLLTGPTSARITTAPLVLADGRVAVCAGSTLHLLDPAAFDALPPLPEPQLRAATGQMEARPPVPWSIRLSYRAATLDVLLSALQPTHPAPLQFVYSIAGVDAVPRITDARTPIHYTGLPPGKHELQVQVRDAYGRTGPWRTLLVARVAAPFWSTWWFYALLAAAGVSATLLWSRYKQRQLLAVHGLRDRIASDLHDEVGSALSSITIGSKLAQRLSGKDNAKLESLLQRMGETSDASLRNISDIVWAIDPKNDEGEALLDRMRTIAVELLEHQGIEVHWTVTGDVAGVKLPMDIRKDLLLIFKEAVHNISKHAAARSVQVELARDHDHLTLRVADDGKGYDEGLTGTGHGLGSMQQRAANIRARWSVTSAPGKGTRIELLLPLARTRQQ